ncbi:MULTISPECIES: hypothetical protein [unclassified Blastococcus]
MLRRVGGGVLAAVLAGVVLGAVSRGLMALLPPVTVRLADRLVGRARCAPVPAGATAA